MQAALQQNPSAQKPDAHWPGFVHGVLFIPSPQLPSTHLRPVTQSASLAQTPRQTFVAESHKNGAHTLVAPSRQRPAPSQVLTPTMAPVSQTPGLQTVSGKWLRHLPVPSQVPSSPQVDLSWATHWLATSGLTPAGVSVQVPSAVPKLHVMHVPPHAVSQQIPSAQKPLPHCAAVQQA